MSFPLSQRQGTWAEICIWILPYHEIQVFVHACAPGFHPPTRYKLSSTTTAWDTSLGCAAEEQGVGEILAAKTSLVLL
eukprot:scaffold97462_cov14-Tisochrysis_lutea.AAC.2